MTTVHRSNDVTFKRPVDEVIDFWMNFLARNQAMTFTCLDQTCKHLGWLSPIKIITPGAGSPDCFFAFRISSPGNPGWAVGGADDTKDNKLNVRVYLVLVVLPTSDERWWLFLERKRPRVAPEHCPAKRLMRFVHLVISVASGGSSGRFRVSAIRAFVWFI